MERLLRSLGKVSLLLPFSGMAVLTFLSSLPGVPTSDALLLYGISIDMNPKLQNLIHIPAFFVLGCLWLVAFEILEIPPRSAMLWTIVFGILFGIADELHQSVVPYRYPGLLDVVLDSIGILLACGTWGYLRGFLFSDRPART
jgi:VanZ family protein